VVQQRHVLQDLFNIMLHYSAAVKSLRYDRGSSGRITATAAAIGVAFDAVSRLQATEGDASPYSVVLHELEATVGAASPPGTTPLPSSLSLSLSLTHTHSLSLTHSLAQSLSHTLSHSLPRPSLPSLSSSLYQYHARALLLLLLLLLCVVCVVVQQFVCRLCHPYHRGGCRYSLLYLDCRSASSWTRCSSRTPRPHVCRCAWVVIDVPLMFRSLSVSVSFRIHARIPRRSISRSYRSRCAPTRE
jgi:hypothetical protein